MLRPASLILLLALWGWPALVGAQPNTVFDRLQRGETARVVAVVDGDTLVLENGVEVRLVGIQAPKLALGRVGFVEWPLAEEAKATLEQLTVGHAVTLYYAGRRVDRYGRALAHLRRDDGLWVQGAILKRGLARVYSFRDNRSLVSDILMLERQARAARRGIWALPFYAVRTPDDIEQHVDSFQLVEGRVLDAAVVRGRIYLNFGEDWHTDFTITVAPEHRELFENAGWDPHALEGRVVRVRGWVKSFNGPMIEATHPEQIEVFE